MQTILNAKKHRGKYLGKSCVSWKIESPDLLTEDIVIEGEYHEEGEGGLIESFETDRA